MIYGMTTPQLNVDSLETWRAQLESRLTELMSEMKPLLDEVEKTKARLQLVKDLLQIERGSEETFPSRAESLHLASDAGVTEICAAILRKAGEPLHISEIKKRYWALGRKIPGQGKESNLLAYITRDPGFKRARKGVYRLVAVAENGSPPNRKRRRRRSKHKRSFENSTISPNQKEEARF
jgi:hypothetical protein